MKRRLLTLLLTLVFCVTSVAPGFAMNADDFGRRCTGCGSSDTNVC